MKKLCVILTLCLSLFFSTQSMGETVVLATGEWAPFIGSALPDKGLHTKVLDKIFTKMGYEIQPEFMTWKRAYELTKTGKYVATYTWSKTPERETEIFYPKNELSISKEVAFYKKSRFPEGLTINNLDDIKKQNLKVVGIASYWYEKELKSKGIEIHLVPKAELAWKVLDKGRADLMIENVDVGSEEMKTALGDEKASDYATTSPLKTQTMYLLFSKNHPDSEKIMNEYDEAVSKLKASGEL